jgi:hypothetical protein
MIKGLYYGLSNFSQGKIMTICQAALYPAFPHLLLTIRISNHYWQSVQSIRPAIIGMFLDIKLYRNLLAKKKKI